MSTETTESMKKLAENIKRLRTEKGLTRYRLAKDISLSYAYLTKLERGEGNPSMDIIDLLAEYFEVEIFELFK